MPELTSAMELAIQEKMRPLRERYFATLLDRMQRVEKIMGYLVSQGTLDDDSRQTLQSEAHKLAGTGLTYGFPDISVRGKLLEDAMLDGIRSDDPALLGLIAELMEVCHDALATRPMPGAKPAAAAPTQGAVTDPTSLPPAAPVQIEPKRPTLLILDDDPDVLNMLSALLRNDAHVVTGENAKDGLALVNSQHPDLILLDNQMPGGISGLTMLDNLRATPELKGIPVIMISASSQASEVMRGLMAGAVDYILKPFDANELASKVRRRLRRMQSSILIADDDPAIRELLELKMRASGCQVVVAEDGDDAWDKLNHMNFSLAIIDLMMPGCDGMTLLRKMKSAPALTRMPVVILSARQLGNDILTGLNSGAADYITKPFNSDEVVTRCTRLLEPLAQP